MLVFSPPSLGLNLPPSFPSPSRVSVTCPYPHFGPFAGRICVICRTSIDVQGPAGILCRGQPGHPSKSPAGVSSLPTRRRFGSCLVVVAGGSSSTRPVRRSGTVRRVRRRAAAFSHLPCVGNRRPRRAYGAFDSEWPASSLLRTVLVRERPAVLRARDGQLAAYLARAPRRR
ncbi:hypothetical protein DCS_05559 [Drechmeria coniospora]|uniref:Uncharacterized protein n=1 Tax=Drechmeria coniospora TaxID=98403 RepID=A0A151GNH1_DRECN|nr:hypothetical protein DCS_05559 [Drechmeria coniospora]KYK58542.1 hypothetical protein DCS_05559 [Drechmeria coniospora]